MMALTAATFTLQSCLDDDDDNDYICIDPSTYGEVVTLKPGTEDNSNWWIQLTDSTVVTCSNIKEFPLKEKKEQRAYIYFNYDSDPSSLTADIKSIAVRSTPFSQSHLHLRLSRKRLTTRPTATTQWK